MSEPLLRAERLVKHFPVRTGLFGRARGAIQAVDDISFELYPGETLALVGESGCGKSTAGKLLLRLLEPTAGTVFFQGRNILELEEREMRSLRREMQVIFQDPYGSLNPRMTVGDMLEEPLRLHRLHPGRERARVSELLGLVGLAPDHAQRYPHEFSGGQRQRIGIARALAVEPRLIVCDEPVSALDVSIQAQVINLLQDLQRQFGLAYVFIAHDLAVVKHIANRVAVMYLGKIVELADKKALFAAPRHPYTRALLSAIPIPDPSLKKSRTVLQGDVPSPYNPPSGCRFRTRCPFVRPLCSSQVPVLENGVACHFWKEIEPYTAASQLTAVNERLMRLQAAFHSGGGPS